MTRAAAKRRAKPPAAPPAATGTATPPLGARRANWIESDAYDRAAFARLTAGSPSLQALAESGGKLLPHFDAFLLDLFALLFKLNLVVFAEETVLPSAGFYRLLIDHIRSTPALEALRQQTVLDETRAGLGTLLLGERLLELLKSERILSRGEMLDFWNLEQREDEVITAYAESGTAVDLQSQTGAAAQRQLAEVALRLRRDAHAAERRLHQHARQIGAALAEGTDRQRARVVPMAAHVLRDLEQAGQDAERWSLQLGGGDCRSAAAQIELGKQLADNVKLRKLGALVGRMRSQALALRRTLFERADEETYAVGMGAELSRLLPHELLALRQPLLRRDFARRFVDRGLLQYTLRGIEEKGKGPLIVCLDGSSSMAGDKEIWSKAVSLTLLEIAQRQRRLFRSICFSSAETPLQVLDLNRRQRYAADMQKVFQLAAYFPGGGTDFQQPLSAALTCLRETPYRRGDVVFITDGECRVDPQWLQEFKRAKAQLGFSLFAVLIDVGSSSLTALKDFSDRVTTISQLTSEASRDIFLKL